MPKREQLETEFSTRQNVFFRQPIDIFISKTHALQRKDFSSVLENFTKILLFPP